MNILSTANNPLEHLHLEHHQDLELQVEAEKHIRQYSPGPVRRAEVQISHHPQLSSIIILKKKITTLLCRSRAERNPPPLFRAHLSA